MSQADKDFSGQNLRGRNFKGQDLTGANFSYADIRGVNFDNAILRYANFTGVVAGLNNTRLILVVIFSVLTIGYFLLSTKYLINPWILSLAGIYLVINSRGTVPATISNHSELFSWNLTSRDIRKIREAGLESYLEKQEKLSLTSVRRISFLYALIDVSIWSGIAIFIQLLKSLLPDLAVTIDNRFRDAQHFPELLLWFLLFLILLFLLKSFLIRTYSVEAVLGLLIGKVASFHNTNLQDANFTDANLIWTNFNRANLLRTKWLKSKILRINLPFEIGEEKWRVERVLTTNLLTLEKGEGGNFDGINLQNANLKEANLENTSFIGANLNYANLQGANLRGVYLKQTQLDGADLTGATLTGAFIEDWGITAETVLDGIRCEYVFMHVPTKEDPAIIRKPDNHNEIFEGNDFADFIRPLTDTLDLYHNQGVDPRAIAIAFKELAENNPEAELSIVAMEVKGDGKFLLRAKTVTRASKSDLSTEYFSTYNQIRSLPEAAVKVILTEKDSRIQSLEGMVVTALQRPSFYSHIERTDSVSNNPGGISQSVSGGNVYGGMQAAQGDGNVQSQDIHSIASSEQGLTQEKVIELLAQLESVLRQPELPGEVQAKAAKYLDAAKEEVQAKEPDKQLAAGNLKRMAETIETTSKTMESSKKIWETTKPILEAVLPWLGVAKSFFGF